MDFDDLDSLQNEENPNNKKILKNEDNEDNKNNVLTIPVITKCLSNDQTENNYQKALIDCLNNAIQELMRKMKTSKIYMRNEESKSIITEDDDNEKKPKPNNTYRIQGLFNMLECTNNIIDIETVSKETGNPNNVLGDSLLYAYDFIQTQCKKMKDDKVIYQNLLTLKEASRKTPGRDDNDILLQATECINNNPKNPFSNLDKLQHYLSIYGPLLNKGLSDISQAGELAKIYILKLLDSYCKGKNEELIRKDDSYWETTKGLPTLVAYSSDVIASALGVRIQNQFKGQFQSILPRKMSLGRNSVMYIPYKYMTLMILLDGKDIDMSFDKMQGIDDTLRNNLNNCYKQVKHYTLEFNLIINDQTFIPNMTIIIDEEFYMNLRHLVDNIYNYYKLFDPNYNNDLFYNNIIDIINGIEDDLGKVLTEVYTFCKNRKSNKNVSISNATIKKFSYAMKILNTFNAFSYSNGNVNNTMNYFKHILEKFGKYIVELSKYMNADNADNVNNVFTAYIKQLKKYNAKISLKAWTGTIYQSIAYYENCKDMTSQESAMTSQESAMRIDENTIKYLQANYINTLIDKWINISQLEICCAEDDVTHGHDQQDPKIETFGLAFANFINNYDTFCNQHKVQLPKVTGVEIGDESKAESTNVNTIVNKIKLICIVKINENCNNLNTNKNKNKNNNLLTKINNIDSNNIDAIFDVLNSIMSSCYNKKDVSNKGTKRKFDSNNINNLINNVNDLLKKNTNDTFLNELLRQLQDLKYLQDNDSKTTAGGKPVKAGKTKGHGSRLMDDDKFSKKLIDDLEYCSVVQTYNTDGDPVLLTRITDNQNIDYMINLKDFPGGICSKIKNNTHAIGPSKIWCSIDYYVGEPDIIKTKYDLNSGFENFLELQEYMDTENILEIRTPVTSFDAAAPSGALYTSVGKFSVSFKILENKILENVDAVFKKQKLDSNSNVLPGTYIYVILTYDTLGCDNLTNFNNTPCMDKVITPNIFVDNIIIKNFTNKISHELLNTLFNTESDSMNSKDVFNSKSMLELWKKMQEISNKKILTDKSVTNNLFYEIINKDYKKPDSKLKTKINAYMLDDTIDAEEKTQLNTILNYLDDMNKLRLNIEQGKTQKSRKEFASTFKLNSLTNLYNIIEIINPMFTNMLTNMIDQNEINTDAKIKLKFNFIKYFIDLLYNNLNNVKSVNFIELRYDDKSEINMFCELINNTIVEKCSKYIEILNSQDEATPLDENIIDEINSFASPHSNIISIEPSAKDNLIKSLTERCKEIKPEVEYNIEILTNNLTEVQKDIDSTENEISLIEGEIENFYSQKEFNDIVKPNNRTIVFKQDYNKIIEEKNKQYVDYTNNLNQLIEERDMLEQEISKLNLEEEREKMKKYIMTESPIISNTPQQSRLPLSQTQFDSQFSDLILNKAKTSELTINEKFDLKNILSVGELIVGQTQSSDYDNNKNAYFITKTNYIKACEEKFKQKCEEDWTNLDLFAKYAYYKRVEARVESQNQTMSVDSDTSSVYSEINELKFDGSNSTLSEDTDSQQTQKPDSRMSQGTASPLSQEILMNTTGPMNKTGGKLTKTKKHVIKRKKYLTKREKVVNHNKSSRRQRKHSNNQYSRTKR